MLTAWGYAVLLPHRRGYGNSAGRTWRQEVTAEFGTAEYDRALAARLGREADDVVAAVDWLGARPEIAAGRIGVIGSSFGGTVSLLAAARCPRLRCAVDFAGAAMNWERTPTLRATMLEAARQLAMPIAPRPVGERLQHGADAGARRRARSDSASPTRRACSRRSD